MDKVTAEGFHWDHRYVGPDESFIVLTDPLRVSHSYVGVFVEGRNGVEMICACVVNKMAFVQYMETQFEEV